MGENKARILFDTDLGGDCDDAGALLLLHRLADKGEAELLAVTHCYASPYYAGCVDAINRFWGREVPVGINYERPTDKRGNHAAAICEAFPNRYSAPAYRSGNGAPDTLDVMRRALAGAEDASVTLVVTGTADSMARLVRSSPDGISPLSGRELIRRKLLRTVMMGGRFFESWPMTIYPDGSESGTPVTWEWNIQGSGYENAFSVFDLWPGELVLSSYEIGSYIKTLSGYPDRAPEGDPVAEAYRLHNGGVGRCSWDLTAMLEAVRPGRYWNYHAPGRIRIGRDMVTRWEPDGSRRHTYLLPKADYGEIRQVIDDLIDGK